MAMTAEVAPHPLRSRFRHERIDETRDVDILGIRVDAVRLTDLLGRVSAAARSRRRLTVMYVNAHCMNVQDEEPGLQAALSRADIVYCDGMGVLMAARLTSQVIPERMTGADWIWDLCGVAEADGLSLFLLGSEQHVVDEASAVLRSAHPALRIVGAESGYGVDSRTVERINRAHPDILLVGMGAPIQEAWIDEHQPDLAVPVLWAVGGLFDVVAGRVRRGPRWMTQHGLEWLCRLVIEPRRLWRRYVFGNPRFLRRVLMHHVLRRPASTGRVRSIV